ncbi:hypothetical protein [Amycolatopsis minnesotensis]|uniref:Excreted virulence factor EspC (Type VII ESX diderm) n=1 Tax=Amycolatopsis minnesotensis TaxID=337894 RepID=A0ABN2R297_9PSEU
MPAPPPGDIHVVTEEIRKDAELWDAEAAEMGKIGPRAEDLRLNRVEAGVFQVVFDAYGQMIDQVIARSAEGQQRMTEIGATLRAVANKYEADEAARVQQLKKAGR